MKPLALRTRLTLLYTVIFSVLFWGFLFAAYHIVARQLEADATEELVDRAEGLRGYIRFEEDRPKLKFDSDDPQTGVFVRNATRFFQIYDLSDRSIVTQSQEMRPLGSLGQQPGLVDIDTSDGPLRFLNDRIHSPSGKIYLMQVGISLRPAHEALQRFAALGLWLAPLALILAATSGWFMASRAMNPVRDIARAARNLDLSNLHNRLPVRGARDELDELAVAFNEAFSRLEHAVGEMKQLMGSMAHELRTPLSALRGEAEIALLHESSAEDYRRVLASQLEELDKLARLTSQLLTLAQAESGLLKLALEPVHVDELLKGIADTFSVIAAAKEVSLDFEPGQNLVVMADPQWLKHAVLNLIDNAIKYTPSGGHVAVVALRDESGITIEIRDTGIGIDADAIPHIFEHFYRADSSRTKDIEGVGLGLSFAKWIVGRHGGDIRVSSEVGQGSCFTLHLPVGTGATAKQETGKSVQY